MDNLLNRHPTVAKRPNHGPGLGNLLVTNGQNTCRDPTPARRHANRLLTGRRHSPSMGLYVELAWCLSASAPPATYTGLPEHEDLDPPLNMPGQPVGSLQTATGAMTPGCPTLSNRCHLLPLGLPLITYTCPIWAGTWTLHAGT